MAMTLDRVRAAWTAFRTHAAKPPPRERVIMHEVAPQDSRLFRGWQGAAYNPSKLVTAKGLDVFDEMMRDDQVRAAMVFARQAVLASGWDIRSPEGVEADWPVTAFVKRALVGMESTVERTLNEILTSKVYGYSVSEIVWTAIDEGEDSGKIGIKAIKTKRPHEIQFATDDFGNIKPDGILQNGIPLPRQKFVVMTNGEAFGSPYGTSELEACYRPWWIGDNAYRWLAQLLEKFGTPPLFLFYDPQKLSRSQVDQLQDILNGIQANTSAMIPRANKDTMEMWSPELAGQVSSVFVPALEHLKQDMARALLMPGLLGVTPDKLGSYARAKVVFDVFMLSVQFTQQAVAEAVMGDQIIKPLVDLNFGGGPYPKFYFKPLTDEAQTELMRTWREMVGAGTVKSSPDDEPHIRQLLGFPTRDAEDEEDLVLNNRQIFSYHMKAQLFTINEIRRAFGLPPIAGGDVPPTWVESSGAGGDVSGEDKEAGSQEDDGGDAAERETQALFAQLRRTPPRPDEDPDAGMPDEGDIDVEEDPPRPFPRPPGGNDLTRPEQRVDFAQIARRWDAAEAKAIGRIARAIRTDVKALGRRLAATGLAAGDIDALTYALPAQAREGLAGFLLDQITAGARDLAKEAGQPTAVFDATSYEPHDAIAWLRAKTDFALHNLDEAAAAIVKGELLTSLKNGLPVSETIKRLLAALAPLAADPARRGQALASPTRLETVVRTLSTEAYNQGRLVQARRLGAMLIPAMQYSAVLDRSTTVLCRRHLHGKIFHLDDDNLTRLTPPNHYRCRSVLVPITLDIAPADGDYITAQEIEAARKLAAADFGGDPKE